MTGRGCAIVGRKRKRALKLYGMIDSGNCYKPRLLMAKLGIPFARVEVSSHTGETRRPDYVAKNPNAMVPMLELDDGRRIAESNAILLYLAIRAITREDPADRSNVSVFLEQQLGFDDTRRRQIGWLTESVLTIAVAFVTLPILLLQWGFSGADIRDWFKQLLFGFEIGQFRISLARILIGIGIFMAMLFLTRVVQRRLRENVLIQPKMDPGIANSIDTAVGYAGGATPNPTYEEACSGRTGHTEGVLVVYDPRVVTYPELLKVFWEGHDPTQGMRQGNDIGTQYRSGIYPVDDAQMQAAEASKLAYQQALSARGYGQITTEIKPAGPFYFAEDYHQQYLAKNPAGYCGVGGTGVTCPIGVGVAG